MARGKKMEEDSDSRWRICKIVEQAENGQLHLLEKHLDRLLHHFGNEKLDTSTPIVFVAFVGSPSGGNALCTNLLATCLKSNGPSWQNELKNNGLKGFAFSENMRIRNPGNGRSVSDNRANKKNEEKPDSQVKTIEDTKSKKFESSIPKKPDSSISAIKVMGRAIVDLVSGTDIESRASPETLLAIEKFVEAAKNVENLNEYQQMKMKDNETCQNGMSSEVEVKEEKGRLQDEMEFSPTKVEENYAADSASSSVVTSSVKPNTPSDVEVLEAQAFEQIPKNEITQSKKGVRYPIKNIKAIPENKSKKAARDNPATRQQPSRRSKRVCENHDSPNVKNINKDACTQKTGRQVKENGPSPDLDDGSDDAQCDHTCLEGNDGFKVEDQEPDKVAPPPDHVNGEAQSNAEESSSQTQPGNDDLKGQLKNGVCYPDQLSSGIYCWPEPIKLDHNDGKLLWILYAHHVKSHEQTPLHILLGLMCSVLVDIQWENMTTISAMNEEASNKYSIPKEDMCQYILKMVKEEAEEDKGPSSESRNFQFCINLEKNDSQTDLHCSMNISTQQCRKVTSLVKAITDEVELKPRSHGRSIKRLTPSNLKEYFNCQIARVNNMSSSKVKSLNHFSTPGNPPGNKKYKTDRGGNPNRAFKRRSKSNHSASSTDESGSHSRAQSREIIRKPVSKELKALPPAPSQATLNNSHQIDEQVMEGILSSQWGILQGKLRLWIETTDFCLDSLNEIHNIYDACMRDFCNTNSEALKSQRFSSEDAVKTTEKILEHIANHFGPIISEIQKGLQAFHGFMDNILKKNTNYPFDQLQSIFQQHLARFLNQFSKNSIEFVELGCTKMISKYVAESQLREEMGETASLQLMQAIREKYLNYFDQQLSHQQPISPTVLLKSHEALSDKLLLALRKTFHDWKYASKKDLELKEQLANDFVAIHAKNMTKLEIHMKEVNQQIKILTKDYENLLDVILRENPSGLDEEKFNAEHETTLKTCIERLIDAIRKKLSEDEPTEVHILALQAFIQKTYAILEAENKGALEEDARKQMKNSREQKFTERSVKREIVAVVIPNKPQIPAKKIAAQTKVVLFQVTLQKIGFAAVPCNNVSNLEPEGMTFYSAVVALNHDDVWLIGDDACKNSKNAKKAWQIEDCLSQNQFTEKCIVNGDHVTVTIEFLLATLFTAIIRKFEIDNNSAHEKSTEVLVAVPYWFSSFHRQQVIDAANISGFTKVRLINENSCSAFCMYSGQIHDPNYDTVVISENSLKVDISLYTFNSVKGTLTMLGHCGDYETKDTKKDNSGGIIYNFITGKLAYYLSHHQDSDVEKDALKSLEELWKITLQRAELKYPGSNSKPRMVLLCCESEKLTNLLWKLAMKICEPDLISVRNDTALHGLAYIYHSQKFKQTNSTICIVSDSTPFNVAVYTSNRDYVMATNVQKSNQNTFSDNRALECKISNKLKSGTVYPVHQVNSGMNVHIANLYFAKLPKNCIEVTVKLERTVDGILAVQKVEHVVKEGWFQGQDNLIMFPDHYVWQTTNLQDTAKNAHKSVITQIKTNSQQKLRPVAGLKETIERGRKIKQAISLGKGNFRNPDTKKDILNIIDKSIKSLLDPSTNEFVVKQQNEVFNDILKNYKIM